MSQDGDHDVRTTRKHMQEALFSPMPTWTVREGGANQWENVAAETAEEAAMHVAELIHRTARRSGSMTRWPLEFIIESTAVPTKTATVSVNFRIRPVFFIENAS